MHEKENIFEAAAVEGAAPSIEAAAAVVDSPQPVDPEFDPRKFLDAEGKIITYRDGTQFSPESGKPWPKMKPDGYPDLTVDGFLRKTNSGKNKGVFKRVMEKVKPPKSDPVLETETLVEKAAQDAEKERQQIEGEAIKQQQLDASTSARAVVAIVDSSARLVGGGSATADTKEKDHLQGAVYRYEMETGRKMPISPEVALFGEFAAIYGGKFEQPDVRKTIKSRFGFLKKAPMLGKLIPLVGASPAPVVSSDPAAEKDAPHPSFAPEEGD